MAHDLLARTALDPADLTGLVTELASVPTLWLRRARFEPAGRWWKLLRHDDNVDIWLLTWLTGHSTDLHDHGGSAGAFTVLQGALTEVRVSPDRRSISTFAVPRGNSVEVATTTIHDVYNAGSTPAVSLHAYSPPLSQMTFYERRLGGVRQRETVETHEGMDAA